MQKFRRVLASTLAVGLTVTMLAGCAGKQGDSQSSEQTQAATTAETTQKAEPVKITFKTYHAPADGNENFVETTVGKVVLEKLNIIVSILPTKAENTDQDMITDIASGSLADIVAGWASAATPSQLTILNKAAKEDVLADLTSAIANTQVIAPSIQKDKLPYYSQAVIYNPEFNGKIYYLPTNQTVVSPWISGWGLYIRDDIAKAVGVTTPAPEIKTADDFYNLLKKIKDGKFKDVNGKEIYPMGNIAQWPHIMAAMSRSFDFGGGGNKIGVDNGKVKSFIESDYAWQQILWFRKLVKDGLLDPEALTHSYDIGNEKMAQGRYAVSGMYKGMPTVGEKFSATLRASHPEMAYKPLGNMVNYKGEDVITMNKGMEAHQIIAISKNANVEAAIKLIDWCGTKEGKATTIMGKEGDQWSFNAEGFAEMKADVYAEMQKDGTAFVQKHGTWALGMFNGVGGADNPDINAFGGDGRNYFLQNDKASNDEPDANVKGVMPKINVINQLNIDFLLNSYPDKDKIEPVMKQMNDILIQCYLTKSETEAKKIYTGYVDTLKKNGFDSFIAFLQAEYDKDPNKYATYVTEVQ